MIPKKIHYCWFSGRPLPREFQRYIDSWKKYCPEYEIIRWDESNYDISRNKYMENAYREARWGFVPDYARFDIIYREGGVYLDTDVELIRPLDALLDNHCYLGVDTAGKVSAGLGFGAEKGNPVILALRDMYDDISFYQEDGSLNLTPSPEYISARLEKMGVRKDAGIQVGKRRGVRMDAGIQRLDQLTVYPKDYFAAKDYSTGQLHLTGNSYSIHHFSCTWMTREEKLAEERRLSFCNRFGDMVGNRVDGVYKRLHRCHISYRGSLPERFREHVFFSDKKNEARLNKLEQSLSSGSASLQRRAVLTPEPVFPQRMVLLTPAPRTDNLGDLWIEQSCMKHFPRKQRAVSGRISTHAHPTRLERKQMKAADLLLVTGSNLLSGNVRHSQWKLPNDFTALSGICLMGCGWSDYHKADAFSVRFYRRLLNNGYIHSVRDRYTEQQLRTIGVENVLYTGCPTMWDLTVEHCCGIPARKSDVAVTALTGYQADRRMDGQQLQILFSLYKEVFFWPQSPGDTHYLMTLLTREERKSITILPSDWKALETLLCTKKPDYIGNRLHAGIFALHNGCRSRIISIDNRATEIGKDTGLPTVSRNAIVELLEKSILDESTVILQMPWENIRLWRRQFEKGTI